jgi:hypothetical protein
MNKILFNVFLKATWNDKEIRNGPGGDKNNFAIDRIRTCAGTSH